MTTIATISDWSNTRRWQSSSRNKRRLPERSAVFADRSGNLCLEGECSARGILGFATKLTLLRIGQFLLAAGFTATVRSALTDKFRVYLCVSVDLLLLRLC